MVYEKKEDVPKMHKDNLERFTVNIPAEIHQKIKSIAEKKNITKTTFVREIFEEFFNKQDEKEILKAILLRLDYVRLEFQGIDMLCNRTNSFLNHYSESTLSEEANKKLRANVLAQINELKKNKGYDKK